MSGRISIKGQGADIFFGEADGEQGRAEANATQKANAVAKASSLPSSESKPASKEAGQPVSQPASLPASQQDSKQAPQPNAGATGLTASTKRKLRDLLEREHRRHNTYRYHEDELAAVRDIVYEFEVRWGRKATRNDVMRAAVLWVIEDYQDRGERSFIVQLLKEED